jgi:soluble lytic murein transglycosylase-like protein
MPATASYVAGDPSLRGGPGAQRLHDPALSLDLGQRYLAYLTRHEAVRSDLIRLLAAYNAGPGNLTRWLAGNGHRDDPFLYIESIPIPETRLFVQRVLAHSWIYASRLGLLAPRLDALATGRLPRLAEPEEITEMLRRSPRRSAATAAAAAVRR